MINEGFAPIRLRVRLDGRLVSTSSARKLSLTLNHSDSVVGVHTLTVVLDAGGRRATATATFRVCRCPKPRPAPAPTGPPPPGLG